MPTLQARGSYDSMLANLQDSLLNVWANIRGWRTTEKLIVIESDDWGSVRMPGPKIQSAMIADGLPVDTHPFDLLDCLESRSDLESLFELLSKHADRNGRPALLTFNTVMGNPNFDAIRNDEFDSFHHELLFDSYVRHHGEDLRDLWVAGVDAGVIRPQFHAREHLNTELWLRDLRAGRKQTRKAFNYGFYAMLDGTSSLLQRNYLAAYWAENEEDVTSIERILNDGLKLFEETFGYSSRSFIPCNYVLPIELERTLAQRGIELIQGQRGQPVPQIAKGGRLVSRRRFAGQKNGLGQCYGVRNVRFEPYGNLTQDWVDTAMREIRQAFLLRRPAVITTHRINYTGGMNVSHRDRCLRLLNSLLLKICGTWSDVIFTSSDELATRMLRG